MELHRNSIVECIKDCSIVVQGERYNVFKGDSFSMDDSIRLSSGIFVDVIVQFRLMLIINPILFFQKFKIINDNANSTEHSPNPSVRLEGERPWNANNTVNSPK